MTHLMENFRCAVALLLFAVALKLWPKSLVDWRLAIGANLMASSMTGGASDRIVMKEAAD